MENKEVTEEKDELMGNQAFIRLYTHRAPDARNPGLSRVSSLSQQQVRMVLCTLCHTFRNSVFLIPAFLGLSSIFSFQLFQHIKLTCVINNE